MIFHRGTEPAGQSRAVLANAEVNLPNAHRPLCERDKIAIICLMLRHPIMAARGLLRIARFSPPLSRIIGSGLRKLARQAAVTKATGIAATARNMLLSGRLSRHGKVPMCKQIWIFDKDRNVARW